jgi:hypothetical protein
MNRSILFKYLHMNGKMMINSSRRRQRIYCVWPVIIIFFLSVPFFSLTVSMWENIWWYIKMEQRMPLITLYQGWPTQWHSFFVFFLHCLHLCFIIRCLLSGTTSSWFWKIHRQCMLYVQYDKLRYWQAKPA